MSFTSPFDDIDIPDVTIYEYLFSDIRRADERVALIDSCTGARVSYGELVDRIDRVAWGLIRRGLQAGDRVGIHCGNSLLYPPLVHGCLAIGAAATTVSTLGTGLDIVKQLEVSQANLLVTTRALADVSVPAARRAGLDSDRVVVVDGPYGHDDFEDLIAEAPADFPTTVDPRTQLALLPFSSGTTGIAKGVKLTHRNLVANVSQVAPLLGLLERDRVLAFLPFFHVYGLTVLINVALKCRASLVIMPRFELIEMLRAIGDHKVSVVFLAPPVAVALAKDPRVDEFDFSSVEIIFSGAAPLDGNIARRVAARLGCKVRQGYGMTELSPVSHIIPFDRDDLPPDSVGLPVPSTTNKLLALDNVGEEISLPPKGATSPPGELCVKGPNVMAGYLDDEIATHQTIDGDGFLHTGDVATITHDGVVTIVDRIKDLIKYKGYQVAPAELEAILLEHPNVADTAVIGVPDQDGNEVPKAFIVTHSARALDEHTVIEYVAKRVAPYKRVRHVQFIDAIPKSAAGKILRRELHSTADRVEPPRSQVTTNADS